MQAQARMSESLRLLGMAVLPGSEAELNGAFTAALKGAANRHEADKILAAREEVARGARLGRDSGMEWPASVT